MIWHFSMDGWYTMKSGCRVAFDSENGHIWVNNIHDWSKLWALEIPPRVKVFLWRLCNHCLPLKVSLVCREIMLLWGLWKQLNNMLWTNNHIPDEHSLSSGLAFLQEWHQARLICAVIPNSQAQPEPK
ncbi:conserved hypothetical protein [Ricinus communis]|uniref:Reverse transcriptase zinc-binding domain-containing protein n=1 Tax=Ricinus communis TaxID=3988 RepID=B9S3K8_RICCO|nr:conserved hypothetical protein [Ricinus communis]